MKNIISEIRIELKENSDIKIRETSKRFFKETITCYGVKTETTGIIGKEFFKLIKSRPKEEIFELCEELWQSGFLEESFIACNWSYFIRKEYTPADFILFEKWINSYVTNWASCDTFCNHTMGEFIVRYPEYLSELKRIAKSENKWMRRAAAVSLIVPARKGLFLIDIMEIADILIMDKEDLVQKGYGWMLKAASQAHQAEIFEYVMSKKAVMPRTAFRYAIEKMPVDLKTVAMQK